MTPNRKRELLEAGRRAMAEWRALPSEEKARELKRIGIIAPNGQLSERYGGPGRLDDDGVHRGGPGRPDGKKTG